MIKIFQINRNRDKNKNKFMAYDWIKDKFDFSIYDEVWSGEIPNKYKTLDGIFEMFNLEHPKDFKGHSLSMSDIVQVTKTEIEEEGFYYCDSFGWKKLEL